MSAVCDLVAAGSKQVFLVAHTLAHIVRIMVGDREAGTIGQVTDGKAVAILRLDRVPDAHAASCGGLPVSLHLPAWAPYGFGEAPEGD